MAVRIEMGTPAEGMVVEEIATRAAVVVEGVEEVIKEITPTMIAQETIVVEDGAEAATGVGTMVVEGVTEGGRRGAVEP
jgi:Holliday junction resolvasome RuvABC endonuclease subunit